jgi:tRNA modification GTPase
LKTCHNLANELISDLKSHLEDGRKGEILREGIKLAILGPPNAGKSSLLNWLGNFNIYC